MNFLQQQQEVCSQLRLDINQAAFKTLAQRWLNQAGKEIWAADEWNFACDRGVVQTVVDETAGTVSISPNTQTVTGVSTAFNTSTDVGKFIQFSSSNDWYKVTAVASSTSLTIEAPYAQTTALSGGTYILRQMLYSMPACEKVLDARQTITPAYIEPVYFRDFDIFRANPLTTGDPLVMVLFGQDSSNNLRFTFYPLPDQAENIEIRFKKSWTDLVNDTDQSLIPLKWNDTVMVDCALARGLTYLSTSDPKYLPVQQMVSARYRYGLQEMLAKQQEDAAQHPVIDNRDRKMSPFGPILPFKFGYDVST